jgi:hypothetical protein
MRKEAGVGRTFFRRQLRERWQKASCKGRGEVRMQTGTASDQVQRKGNAVKTVSSEGKLLTYLRAFDSNFDGGAPEIADDNIEVICNAALNLSDSNVIRWLHLHGDGARDVIRLAHAQRCAVGVACSIVRLARPENGREKRAKAGRVAVACDRGGEFFEHRGRSACGALGAGCRSGVAARALGGHAMRVSDRCLECQMM